MLDFLFGMGLGKMLFSSHSENADYEQQQMRQVMEIGNAINLMGSTLPADTDISEALKKLKVKFDAIDASAIKNPIGQKNCLFTRICGRTPVPVVRQAGDISTLLQF